MRRTPLIVAGVAVLAAFLPLAERWLPGVTGQLLPAIFACTIIGLGLNLVTGMAGQLHLGIAAQVAIGAYAYSILASDVYPFCLGFWSAFALATAIAAATGAALAVPTLRLRGDYLAIVTLGFGEIVQDLLKNLEPITKGMMGIDPVPPPTLFSLPVGDGTGLYEFYLALTLLAALLAQRLRWSARGRTWVAVREDELAARACGVDTARAKLTAFAWGSAFAGAGGALLVAQVRTSFDPSYYDFQLSVMVLCAVILGGMGSIGGVVLGSAIIFGFNALVLERVTHLLEGKGVHSLWLSPGNWKYLLFGLALILVMRVRPQGLWPAREIAHRDPRPPTPGAAG